MKVPLLELKNVTKVFDATTALQDFSLTFFEDNPTVTTIAGESGSGKTTLANLVLGFLVPTSGAIFYKGRDIRNLSKKENSIFRKEVQAIFQDPYESYNPFYKVDRMFKVVIKKFKLSVDENKTEKMVEEALEVVGLKTDEVLGRYPHQLSGGQRQRLIIARAFLLRPRLIVADEPVSMIDASLRAGILETMLKLKKEFGISFLYITHDLSTAYQISDRMIILYQGLVVERGEATEVIENPQHPYTQLLISSIPSLGVAKKWRENLEIAVEEKTESEIMSGCKFYNRCPHGTKKCLKSSPAEYRINQNHYVSCYLYEKESQDK